MPATFLMGFSMGPNHVCILPPMSDRREFLQSLIAVPQRLRAGRPFALRARSNGSRFRRAPFEGMEATYVEVTAKP